ncbi:MAG: YihY/virulence factor BrkB family protein [Haloechinothrix sp.]
MSTSDDTSTTAVPADQRRKGPFRLLGRTMRKAWDGNIFSEAAEAAFWQTLSLPPLLLGLLGCLGYIGDWFGETVVLRVREEITGFSETIFSGDVVDTIIDPTVNDMLTVGKGEIASIGFLIALWAGSSAMSSFVDAITLAHDQHQLRHEVWQRIFALLLYLASLVVLIIGLPLVAIGPDLAGVFFPADWQPFIRTWVNVLYYPALGVLIVLSLATLYKLALPRKLPFHRGLPGAMLAMLIFLLSSAGLRFYLAGITQTGYTYGALATPIAFLLFAFFIGLAVVGGAYFNSAIEELWPARPTRRQRRKWRRLELERANERLHAEEGKRMWERATTPLHKSREPCNGVTSADNGRPVDHPEPRSVPAPPPHREAVRGEPAQSLSSPPRGKPS